MRRSVLALALLCATTSAFAAPPPEVPAEVKGEVGAFVAIRAKTEGSRVVFVPIDLGLNVFPADLLADKKATVVTSARPGRYRILCYSAVGTEPTDPAIVVVVIGGDDPPVPPVPPPNPPGPKPPEPDAALVKKLAEAFARDGGSKDDVQKLAALYKLGAELVLKLDVPNSSEMYRRLREAGASLANSLTNTRLAVAAELSAQLGAPSDIPYSDAQRTKAASVFLQIATALDAVSK
jgi:hypothetical protein